MSAKPYFGELFMQSNLCFKLTKRIEFSLGNSSQKISCDLNHRVIERLMYYNIAERFSEAHDYADKNISKNRCLIINKYITEIISQNK